MRNKNIERFVKRFAAVVRADKSQWTITDNGHLRPVGTSERHCPLSYIAGTRPCTINASATVLDLSLTEANKIACAADRKGRSALRLSLLKAAGIKSAKKKAAKKKAKR